MTIEIFYCDRDLLICRKPVGVLSQSDGKEDMVALLSAQLAAEGEKSDIFPVHRLDRGVGGVMVFARSAAMAGKLTALVAERSFEKEYLALAPDVLETAEGVMEDLLYRDREKNKSFVVKRERKGVRLASLSYQVLRTVTVDEGTFSLVLVRLHTGRTHQIRVQFASRGMPLAGDSRYGGFRGCRLGLWSHSLAFPHPITGQPVSGLSEPDKSAAPWCWFTE